MKEALIVCDANCISRKSLFRVLDEIKHEHANFEFRMATPEEEEAFIKKFGNLFRPFVVIGKQPIFGVPPKEKVLELLEY